MLGFIRDPSWKRKQVKKGKETGKRGRQGERKWVGSENEERVGRGREGRKAGLGREKLEP